MTQAEQITDLAHRLEAAIAAGDEKMAAACRTAIVVVSGGVR